jgi:hypothetical protein
MTAVHRTDREVYSQLESTLTERLHGTGAPQVTSRELLAIVVPFTFQETPLIVNELTRDASIKTLHVRVYLSPPQPSDSEWQLEFEVHWSKQLAEPKQAYHEIFLLALADASYNKFANWFRRFFALGSMMPPLVLLCHKAGRHMVSHFVVAVQHPSPLFVPFCCPSHLVLCLTLHPQNVMDSVKVVRLALPSMHPDDLLALEKLLAAAFVDIPWTVHEQSNQPQTNTKYSAVEISYAYQNQRVCDENASSSLFQPALLESTTDTIALLSTVAAHLPRLQGLSFVQRY